MDFKLTEEQEAMREMAKNFAEKKIAPTMEEDEKEHRFRKEIVKEMARLGFFGCIAPEKYGGNESGYLAASVMTEEIAKDLSFVGTSLQPSDELHPVCPSQFRDGGTAGTVDSEIDQCGPAWLFRHHRSQHRIRCGFHEVDGQRDGGRVYSERDEDVDLRGACGRCGDRLCLHG